MKINNPFFKKINEIKLLNICKALNVKNSNENTKIFGINDLKNAKKNEISFFNSLKYLYFLKNTKAKFVITNIRYKNVVNKYSTALIVENILKSVGILTSLFYPNALNDLIDLKIDEKILKNIKILNMEKCFSRKKCKNR